MTGFPVTINGNEYEESDFVNYGHLTNFPAIVADVATVGAQAQTAATEAKTAGGYPYVWESTTTAADPGTGKIKANNAALGSATALYISETNSVSQAMAAIIASWDDSTSTIKGFLKLYKQTDLTTFALYAITGTITDGGAWDTITVSYIGGNGTLADDDAVAVSFIPKGDKGDTGATGAGASDGDKGDITVSGTGTVWTIDADVKARALANATIMSML